MIRSLVLRIFIFAVLSYVLLGCTSLPKGIEPVDNFELSSFLGKWYEIARLDHSFERGLEQVTANYTLRDDGGVRVLNRGFNPENQKWQEAEGKAYFVGDENLGNLKVSFFGPFYASYVIFDLDQPSYQYAMVTGPNRDYFWILARQPSLDPSALAALLEYAKAKGFATEQLIYVQHTE